MWNADVWVWVYVCVCVRARVGACETVRVRVRVRMHLASAVCVHVCVLRSAWKREIEGPLLSPLWDSVRSPSCIMLLQLGVGKDLIESPCFVCFRLVFVWLSWFDNYFRNQKRRKQRLCWWCHCALGVFIPELTAQTSKLLCRSQKPWENGLPHRKWTETTWLANPTVRACKYVQSLQLYKEWCEVSIALWSIKK